MYIKHCHSLHSLNIIGIVVLYAVCHSSNSLNNFFSLMLTVRSQPNRSVWTFRNEWATGICGCFGDLRTCCSAFFCFPCFMCRLHEHTGECPCIWCCPGGNTALRTKLRTGFRIRGSICGDACTMLFCPCCAAIQMYDELELQGF